MVKVGNSPGDTRTTSPSESLGPQASGLTRMRRAVSDVVIAAPMWAAAAPRDCLMLFVHVVAEDGCRCRAWYVASFPFIPSGWFESSAIWGLLSAPTDALVFLCSPLYSITLEQLNILH
jgi:hypothetical protein